MDRKNLSLSLAACAVLLLLNACGGAAGTNDKSGATANTAQPAATATGATTASGAAPSNAVAPPDTATAPNAATAPPNAAPGTGNAARPAPVPPAEAVRPETNRTKPAPTPPPQIGSGGNDLFLFTQTRAALNADAELKGVNPVIEIKGGVVTLTGKVATAAQKSRAEQVARGVAGVKSVNNQLQVSAGK